jgi:hypothetical protein
MTDNNISQDGSPSGDTPPNNESCEIVDDTVNIGAPGAGWIREEYTDRNGNKRIRLTKRQ